MTLASVNETVDYNKVCQAIKTDRFIIMTTGINKNGTVPTPKVTKSGITMGFIIADLVENEVWLVDLISSEHFSKYFSDFVPRKFMQVLWD